MKYIKENWLIMSVLIYFTIYTPIGLIGFIFGGLSSFNIVDTYQYCVNGEVSCRYRFELYLYVLSVSYIFYRLFRWVISTGRKDRDQMATPRKIATVRDSTETGHEAKPGQGTDTE